MSAGRRILRHALIENLNGPKIAFDQRHIPVVQLGLPPRETRHWKASGLSARTGPIPDRPVLAETRKMLTEPRDRAAISAIAMAALRHPGCPIAASPGFSPDPVKGSPGFEGEGRPADDTPLDDRRSNRCRANHRRRASTSGGSNSRTSLRSLSRPCLDVRGIRRLGGSAGERTCVNGSRKG